jgi:hypothetical protein
VSPRGPRRPWPPEAKLLVAGLAAAVIVLALIQGSDDDPTRPGSASSIPRTASPAGSTPPSTAAPSATEASSPPTTAATPTSTTVLAPTTTAAPPPGAAAVDRLVVAAADPGAPRYERDRFGGDWDYDPASGCNTRERVLIEEALAPPTVDDRCHPLAGRWRSLYDGVVTTDPDDLQIDHLVPLADAWRSGAHAWTDERRRTFANDRSDPDTLIAVTGTTNQSKSDSTPDEWMPPDREAWCDYATAWVDVKLRWHLTVTPPEKATLVQVLATC